MDDKLWQVCKLLSSNSFLSLRKVNWFPENWVNTTMVRESFFLFCLLSIVMVKRTSVCLSVYVCLVVCASKRFVLLPRNVCFLQSSLDMFVQYSVWCYFLFIISGGTDVLISARYLKTVFFFLVILLLLFCFLVKVVLLPDLIDLTDSFHNYFCGEQLSLWCG